MLFLTDPQIRAALSAAELIRVIREAFARDFHSTLRMPVRSQLDLGASLLLLMPCHDTELHAAGIKIVTVSQQAGLNATYTLLDPNTGRTLAVMEANYLTDIRTAAVSAVATDALSRPEVQTLGVFGSGRQAKAHFSVLPHVRAFRRYLVCGSGRSNLDSFCRTMQQDQGMDIEPVNAETCARESDVLCACTTSPAPLFNGHWLRPGTHLNLVGTFQPHTREVDDETVRRSRVVVDTYEGALAEAGDLLIPIRNGAVTQNHIIADLHQLAGGKKQVRTAPEDITLFKSVGCALEDLVTACLLYNHFSTTTV